MTDITSKNQFRKVELNKLYNVEFYYPDDDYLKVVLQKDDFKPRPIMPLAHYTKMETVIEDILPNEKNRLLLKELFKTNDPVESKKSFSQCFSPLNISDLKIGEHPSDQIQGRKKDISILEKDYWKLVRSISFSADTKTERKAYSIPTMWAHYGQNHEGVCLVFHKKSLKRIFSANFEEKVRKSSIKYDKLELPDLKKEENESSEEFFLKHADELFFKKDSDWGSESEYRFVVVNPEKVEEDGKCYLDGIDQALVAIVLGLNFNENFMPSIENLIYGLTNKNISLYQLSFYNGEFKLHVKNGVDIFDYKIIDF